MPRDLGAALLLGLTVLLVALAVLTTLPFPSSRPNLIGYRSLCAFVPLSTLILIGAAGFVLVLRSQFYQPKTRARRSKDGQVEEHPQK